MTLGVYVRLGRVSNLPTVWTNVLAGVVLAGGAPTPAALAVVALALSLFYVGGMYLNDAFDREIDARERPGRPIPAGLVSARRVFALGFGMLGGALALLGGYVFLAGPAPGWAPVAAGLVLAAAIVFYDARHARLAWSPVVMGLCRALVYVTAALAVSGRLPPPLLWGAAVLLAYLIGLSYVARQETLAALGSLWPLAFLAAPFAYAAPALAAGPLAAALYLGFLGWVGWAVWLLLRRGKADIPRAVVSLLAGISLLDALLIALAGQGGAAGWCLAGFALTLLLQREVPAT